MYDDDGKVKFCQPSFDTVGIAFIFDVSFSDKHYQVISRRWPSGSEFYPVPSNDSSQEGYGALKTHHYS